MSEAPPILSKETLTGRQKPSVQEQENRKLLQEARREKVGRLYWEFGLSQQAIASQLGINRETVVKDLAILRRQVPDAVRRAVKDDRLFDLYYRNLKRLEEVLGKAHRDYLSIKVPDKSVMAARSYVAMLKDAVFIQQQLGVAEPVSQNVTVNNSSTDFSEGIQLALTKMASDDAKHSRRGIPHNRQSKLAADDAIARAKQEGVL